MTAAPKPKRVLLHVGTPKTGTSHLQDVLFRNRDALARNGICYPADRFDAHFLAALDLMKLPWGGLEKEAVGAWDRLAEAVDDWFTNPPSRWSPEGPADGVPHTAIISHEILARATRSQAERALVSLGRDRGVEVHVLLSVRDLTRQIPAEWQENVKHRAVVTYADFLAQLTDESRSGRIGSWFWAVQEIPAIIERWTPGIPPERVHLITVPAPGAPPDELWRRFSVAFGLRDIEADLDLTPERANPSLGVPETALLRRINAAVVAELKPVDYRPLVRELIAHQTLSQRRGSARLALPPDLRGWVRELSESWVPWIEERGYVVHGDLADLLGADPGEEPGEDHTSDWSDPDAADVDQMNAAAIEAIKALLHEAARIRVDDERLHRETDQLRAALAQAQKPWGLRARERVVRSLGDRLPGRLALAVYRRARGRSSRSV